MKEFLDYSFEKLFFILKYKKNKIKIKKQELEVFLFLFFVFQKQWNQKKQVWFSGDNTKNSFIKI